jgi:phosphoglycolate phosphatase
VRRVDLVVFDLDGTLIDSAGDLARSVNAALERLAPGTPPVPLDRVRTYIGDGAAMLVSRTLAAAGMNVSKDVALPVFLECYQARLLDTTVLYPGVLEALDTLRDRRLAVLTNKPGDMSRRILEGLGVAGRFALIWGAGDVPAKKPDPAGLRMMLDETGISPAAVVLVGDSAIDVRTGRAAGVLTVGVTYGLDPASLEGAPPDLVIGDLRELAPALRRLTVLP